MMAAKLDWLIDSSKRTKSISGDAIAR
jgi:hypothetical protein